jgi:hypothetical protein
MTEGKLNTEVKPSTAGTSRVRILARLPDITRIDRTEKPNILSLDQAADWILREKPVIWSGSVCSNPKPSSLPTGRALTQSLIRQIFEGASSPEEIITAENNLTPYWPLEALIDECGINQFDISNQFLKYFAQLNEKATFNSLHRAIVKYYERRLASIPLFITSNWDTLQEQAFREAGYSFTLASPHNVPDKSFGRANLYDRHIFIYHPHGSFETNDPICSYQSEQGQLELSMDFANHSTLFLGYSGYEPSLYRKLENVFPQLWCIKSESELDNPAKRRLLCRPNVSVFSGDLCELFRRLALLEEGLEFTDIPTGVSLIPQKVKEVIRTVLIGTVDLDTCFKLLIDTLLSFCDPYEGLFRYRAAMKALIHHSRNRISDHRILSGLMSSAAFRYSEQTWISVLAYLLRTDYRVQRKAAESLFSMAEVALQKGEKLASAMDDVVYSKEVKNVRKRMYKSYLNMGEKIKGSQWYIAAGIVGADMAAEGEFVEILAFEYLRDGKLDYASNSFDYAATSFYLRGLWNAGRLNEWASKHPDKLVGLARQDSLFIPDDNAV